MKPLPKLLSKTKIMRGYQCLKSIYLTVHHKELEPKVTPELQTIFDQGNEVGVKAREKFKNGVLVENSPWDFIGALKKTRELLKAETESIFEAAFEYKGCFARADIICFSKITNRWTVYEVKSTTTLKEEHLDDVGLQAWIMANAGLPIEKVCVLHLNPNCRYPNLTNLFTEVDVTEELRNRHKSIAPRLNDIFKTLQAEEVPVIDIGPHCSKPYDCPFFETCSKEKNIPKLSVFNLPRIGEKKWELYKDGIIELTDTRLNGLNELQARLVEAFKTKKRFINIKGIQAEITKWKFPLVFLDFETINPAIPRYDGTGPYQQVPFQFSVHILQSVDSPLEHIEYLHEGSDDPRPLLIPKLLEACGSEGSIVSYYEQFETTRIKEMVEQFLEYAKKLTLLLDRFVDPLPIIRENIYDNAFNGSFSLKDVAPAILGDQYSYDRMMVADGTAAQRAFEEMISTSITKEKKQELRAAMLDYCKKDTLVMVELVKWLYKQ